MRLVLILALLAPFSPAPALAAEPVWTANVGEFEIVEVEDSSFGINRSSGVGWIGDTALLVVGLLTAPGGGVVVASGLDGETARSQFGAQFQNPLRIHRVIGNSQSALLVTGLEDLNLPTERPFLASIDVDGRLRWAAHGSASLAMFPSPEIVALVDGSRVEARAADDGRVIWVREFNDLLPEVDADTTLSAASTPSYPLVLRAVATGPDGLRQNPFIINLDAQTGETLWQWRAEPALGAGSGFCEIAEVDGDLVLPWRLSNGTMLMERRNGADGSLVWRTALSNWGVDFGPCPVVANPDVVAILSWTGSSAQSFAGLDAATGVERWRSFHVSEAGSDMLDLGSDGLLLVDAPTATGVTVQRVSRSDGTAVWSSTLTGSDWARARINGSTIEVAGRVEASTDSDALQIWQLNLADGVESTTRVEALLAKRALPSDARFLDGIPYLLSGGLGEDRRGLELTRLDQSTGEVVWTRNLTAPAAPISVADAHIHSDGTAGVMVVVESRDGDHPTATTIARFDAFGQLHYQVLLPQPTVRFGYPLATHGDGEFSVGYQPCTATVPCFPEAAVVARFDNSGLERWRRPGKLVAASGDATVVWNASEGQTQTYDPVGNLLWQRSDTGMATDAAFAASTMALLGYEGVGSIGAVVLGLTSQSGVAQWIDRPLDDEGVRINGDSINLLAATGQWLMIGAKARFVAPDQRFRNPVLASYDTATGQSAAIRTLDSGVDPYLALGRPLVATPTEIRTPGLRLLDGEIDAQERRVTIARLDTQSLQLDYEHLIARDLDPPLGRLEDSSVTALLGDQSVLVEASSETTDGVYRKSLMRLPALSAALVDLQLSVVNTDAPITALGPSVPVALRVHNAGPNVAVNLTLGSSIPDGEASAVLYACQLEGAGACPDLAALPTAAEVQLTLNPGAAAVVRFEVYGNRYLPQRQPLESTPVKFYVEPAYAVADTDLGDNVVVAQISLGGFGNGFE